MSRKKIKHFCLFQDLWLARIHCFIGGNMGDFKNALVKSYGKDIKIIEGEKPAITIGELQEDADGYQFSVFFPKSGTTEFFLWVRARDLSVLVHESLHLTSSLLAYKGIEGLNDSNEEAFTYTQEWLFNKIREKVKFNN